MLKNYAVLSYILLVSIFLSCNENNKEEAFIGGEIINPKNNYVGLYDTDGKILDSLELNNENRFYFNFTDLTPGLYSITHGGEYQMVLIEPQDSLMLRLNTYDFDESLVFTGRGSKKNNFLIQTYLSNEKEAENLVTHSRLKPDEFHNFIERRRTNALDHFRLFSEKNNTSELFNSIIIANINYSNYADKEIYPFAYFGNNKLDQIRNLPKSFYAYRENVDFNLKHLHRFFAYNRFLFHYFDNVATYSYYSKNPILTSFNRHEANYNISKLILIDSIITDKAIKNNLLKYKTSEYISHNHTQIEVENMLNSYLELSTNNTDKEELKRLVNSLKNMRKGNFLPKLHIENYDGNSMSLNDIITKPSIIYFWSSHSKMQYRNSHYKVNELKNQFPYLNFISINVNTKDDATWKKIINSYNFPTDNEYRFKNANLARETLVVNYLNKAIIVNENGVILHPNLNIFSSKFSEFIKTIKH